MSSQKSRHTRLFTNIKNIEKAYKVTIVLRDDSLRIVGVEENVKRAVSVVEQMINLSKSGCKGTTFRPMHKISP